MRFIRSIYYSFMVQLLLLHLKRHPILLGFWLILFLSVTGALGRLFGVPYLFLDPEYLGKVSFLSFFIVGLCLGGFIMTFHIVSYMLNSYRFPFLATLHYPFYTYLINNSLIPASFVFTYLISLYRFQSGFNSTFTISINIFSLLLALLIMWGLFLAYFTSFNVNISKLKKNSGDRSANPPGSETEHHESWERKIKTARIWPVENFISRNLTLRPVRGVSHYDAALLIRIFRQHHFTAFIVQVLSFALLVFIGYFIDYPVFVIPAAGSVIILLATLMMLEGALNFWSRGWRFIAYILLLLLFSLLIRYGWADHRNEAYGLDYDVAPRAYLSDTLAAINNFEAIHNDRLKTLKILDNWLHKAGKKKGKDGKLKMIFIAASGGGSRASAWSMAVMQKLDSLFAGRVMDHTVLMAGASGGILGTAYYRELKLQQIQGAQINPNDIRYYKNITRDLLNPLIEALVVNDFLFPWRTVNIDGRNYHKDRAYIFEQYFNRNTGGVLDKRLVEYAIPEEKAQIPMMILSPTIINDERFLFISPRPVRYLTRPLNEDLHFSNRAVDGVDFQSFFNYCACENIKFTTALRLNATYPYILPPAQLPSIPSMQIMDAGIRDNYGIETIARFIGAFREWINQNTEGIIIIGINAVNNGSPQIAVEAAPSLMKRLLNPIWNLYYNWVQIQEYNNNFKIDLLSTGLDVPVQFLEFNYIPGPKERAASMSFHLTEGEKKNIRNAMNQMPNKEAMEQLKRQLGW